MNLAPIKKLFKKYPQIKLGYLFGSRATGDIGPNSDYDFAIYLSTSNPTKQLQFQCQLISDLCGLLRTDLVDLLILNQCDQPELKYHIVSEGILFYAIEPYQLLVEPQILNEYFDHKYLLRKYKLTKT